VISVAEVADGAIVVIDTEGLANGANIVAHVGIAIFTGTTDTTPSSITDPGEIESAIDATWLLAEVAVGPERASPGPIAITIQTASGDIFWIALRFEVETFRYIDAIARAVADSTFSTFVIRVRAVGNEGAGTFQASHITGIAIAEARLVTAETVGAER